MRVFFAALLLSITLLGSPLSTTTIQAAPASSSSAAQVDMRFVVGGGIIGGGGTLFFLIKQSKTKSKAYHADHRIDLQNSAITYRNDTLVRTDKRRREKK